MKNSLFYHIFNNAGDFSINILDNFLYLEVWRYSLFMVKNNKISINWKSERKGIKIEAHL